MGRARRVALIGLDGSGKSANIEQLQKDPDFAAWKFVWVRWKPMILSPVYWLLQSLERKKFQEKETFISSQENRSVSYRSRNQIKKKLFHSGLVRRIWMTIALGDYLIQFYWKTLKLLVKGESILFDRYYLDLFVDQGISFSYSPDRICREIQRFRHLFPKLDQIVYIRAQPKVCYGRKSDIPDLEYLEKRYAVYEKLKENEAWTVVDGEAPFDSVFRQVKRIVGGQRKEQSWREKL